MRTPCCGLAAAVLALMVALVPAHGVGQQGPPDSRAQQSAPLDTSGKPLVRRVNLRDASAALLKQGPSVLSGDKVLVLVRGGNIDFLRAAHAGAEDYAQRTGRPAVFVYTRDNDADSSTIFMEWYVLGLPQAGSTIKADRSLEEVRKLVAERLEIAYRVGLEAVSGKSKGVPPKRP